jgi:hypothetical protein
MIDPTLNAAVKFGKADGAGYHTAGSQAQAWEPAKIGAARCARVFAANAAISGQWFR